MQKTSSVSKLHWAAQAGDIGEIMRLIEAGAEINARDDCGNTPLKYASAEPSALAVRTLLEFGAQANLADKRGFTPLHCAAGHGFYEEAVEIVSLLIQHGADVNARSEQLGFVPLHEARGVKVIDLLLSHGADPFIKDSAGLTPIEYMTEHGKMAEAAHLKASITNAI